MKVTNEMIKFKSTPENFVKEISDLKNNTFRKRDGNDARFITLFNWMNNKIYGKIMIVCTDTSITPSFFVRQVRDVTFWNDYVIITWEEAA